MLLLLSVFSVPVNDVLHWKPLAKGQKVFTEHLDVFVYCVIDREVPGYMGCDKQLLLVSNTFSVSFIAGSSVVAAFIYR